MTPSLLIVEEALRDLKAHWFEYIKTITAAAQAQGWRVDVACHRDAAAEIQAELNSFPVFRYARYLDNKTSKLPGERYYGFLLHSVRMLRVLWPLLNQGDRYTHIFVPTVLIHHLLAWWIIMRLHPRRPQHLTLFFVANPGVWNTETQTSILPRSPLLTLQRSLLRLFEPMVQQGRVTLGVETKGAQREFETLTGLPFALLPHPVMISSEPVRDVGIEQAAWTDPSTQPPEAHDHEPLQPSGAVVMQTERDVKSLRLGCYGFARYEKGSDILKAAIQKCLNHHPKTAPRFCIQWVDPFDLPDGTRCTSDDLRQYPDQVQIIDRPLLGDDYQVLLAQTDCMVLPYRNSSYHARVSRVALEAVCLGIPMIYTKEGWLEEIVNDYGAGIGIHDEQVDDLVEAIATLTTHYDEICQRAIARQTKAQAYFSGATFCNLLLSNPSE